MQPVNKIFGFQGPGFHRYPSLCFPEGGCTLASECGPWISSTSLARKAKPQAPTQTYWTENQNLILRRSLCDLCAQWNWRSAEDSFIEVREKENFFWTLVFFSGVGPGYGVYACMLSRCSRIWLSATLWTAGHQAPLSTEFSRQEYCSGLPVPSPGVYRWVLAKCPDHSSDSCLPF